MAETIHLTVQEQNQQVPMTVEQARIIEAISPEASVERVEGGAELTVTDYRGTTSVVINDGEPGEPGDPGQPGVSPTVTVTDITGGHRITVTDATGPHSFDVMNGEPGEPGDPAKLIDDASTTAEDRTWSAKKLNNEIDQKYTKPTNGIPATDLESGVIPAVPVQDVQVNGTSVLSQGVANVPIATANTPGVLMVNSYRGLSVYGTDNGVLTVNPAADSNVKAGSESYRPIAPAKQHQSVFYGLAKAAGDSTQSQSSNAVGTYTESAKSAISQMLDAPETVSGTTPSITAKPGVRYVCGECATLTIVAPASGCIDVTFTSGSTATVLTVSSAKTGVSAIKWANGFDPTSLDANTTYEVNILDGEFGVVGSWT